MSQQLLMYAPAAVGSLVGLGVLGFFTLRKRPQRRAARVARATGEWEEREESFANRRTSVRRDGAPVQVLLASPTLRGGQGEGYVLDRSTGGLRVASTAPVAAGSVLQVRAGNAPDTVPWVSVLVRSCRDTGPHYELGCEFEATPPWNVLLLFG